MSGSKKKPRTIEDWEGLVLDRLEGILDRRYPIDALDALRLSLGRRTAEKATTSADGVRVERSAAPTQAVDQTAPSGVSITAAKTSVQSAPRQRREAERVSVPLSDTALALDSTVFLRLAGHRGSADMIDYLDSRHTAPLIVPGQTVQEFWNSHLGIVDTVAGKLKGKYDQLALEIAKIGTDYGTFRSEMEAVMGRFATEYGHVYEESALRQTSALLSVMQKRGLVSYVPRARFTEVAAHRKRTKTPPGFKDDGDGDFFVWADYLRGLMHSQLRGATFSRAVMVTLDQKVDWSRLGVPHPILCAEVKSLLNVSFEVWTIEQLYAEISAVASMTRPSQDTNSEAPASDVIDGSHASAEVGSRDNAVPEPSVRRSRTKRA